ncbi:MAG: excisionase family protein [Waterburya sp.]
MITLTAQESIPNSNWINKRTAAEILGISTHTLKFYRQRHWTLGIHYQYLNCRTIRYHEGLLRDWFANISQPLVHQRAIEVYLASLLSNQHQKRRRKSK